MSEFSESVHIRTSDSAKTESLLVKQGHKGLVFGPQNSWLTFVPFPDEDDYSEANLIAVANKILKEADDLVLHYTFAEDHMWSFTVLKPNHPPGMFVAGWDPEPEVWRDRLDLSVFENIATPKQIEPLLKVEAMPALPENLDIEDLSEMNPDELERLMSSLQVGGGRKNAYEFAELLALPAFKWLSPRYVERDTEQFIEDGARLIGPA